jgi:hypothetical protein
MSPRTGKDSTMSSAHENQFRPTLEALEDRSLPSISLRPLLLHRPPPAAPPAHPANNNPPAGGFSIPNFSPFASTTHNLITGTPTVSTGGFSTPGFSPFASTTHNLGTPAPQTIDPAAISQALANAMNTNSLSHLVTVPLRPWWF